MPFPVPNRHLLYTHPEPVDIQRILHNAFQLNLDIAAQLQGHMPFGVALTKEDRIHFIGYRGGSLEFGLIESVVKQLTAQKDHLKGCARCARVEMTLESGQQLTALQILIEHRGGYPLCIYQPIDAHSQWWVETGECKVLPTQAP